MKKYNKELKKILMEQFLQDKNITFDKCTKRQKQILTNEEPNIWEFYQWNL